jgi:hypothetical protein
VFKSEKKWKKIENGKISPMPWVAEAHALSIAAQAQQSPRTAYCRKQKSHASMSIT